MQTNVMQFIQDLLEFYGANGRHDMQWREDTRAYYVLVSELMLQQTQVDRVKPKFALFIQKFPNWQSLARADQATVLTAWQGLGYNRRALFLHKTAKIVVEKYNSSLPDEQNNLIELPGIGPNTAGAILAFAFNKPIVFIETNIRRVIIYSFFTAQESVGDTEVLAILEKIIRLLPKSEFEPRTFYWAMMDYGAFIKSIVPNPNKQSKHYTLQSKFEGSDRQLRGKILRALIENPQDKFGLQNSVDEKDSKRFSKVLSQLEREGFVQINKKVSLK